MNATSLLVALAPGLPAFLALLWIVKPARGVLRPLVPWAALPATVAGLHGGHEGVDMVLPLLLVGLEMNLDSTGRVFLLFTGLLWLLAGAFARGYHADDPEKDSFLGLFTLTMAGNVGLIVAGDIVSFYLCFAVMTFAAYGLVVHRRDGEALRAGRIYIVMAVAGELLILSALFTLGWAGAGGGRFGAELAGAWAALPGNGTRELVALALVVGFAVKAGLAPVHLWLPLAHPVAPTAASALLSGAMIKAGLLAWLRYLPVDQALSTVGTTLLVGGTFTAFYGVVVGLTQKDPKTILAYSSVSQMGYMAVAAGLLARSPEWAPAAVFAAGLYAFHHGVAKGALFLSVGVGDRWSGPRARPLILLGAAVPALALVGAPLTSGARAKGALKEALELLGGPWYSALDPLLLLAAAGTTVLMARFLWALARKTAPAARAEAEADAEDPWTNGASAPPWPLVAPWGIAVAGAAVGHLVLPYWLLVPPGVPVPPAAANPVESGVPVLLGIAVAGVVWKRPELLGPVGSLRLPPGDVLVPLERAVIVLGRFLARPIKDPAISLGEWFRVLQLWSHDQALWGAQRDVVLARGPLLALLFLVLLTTLALLLPG